MWARMLGNLWIIASFVPEIFRRRWSSCSGCFAGAGGLLHCGDRWQSPRHGWQSINLDTAFPAEEPRAQRISDPNTPGYYQRWSILHHLRWIERWHRRNTQTRTNAGSWIAKGAYSCAATAVAAAGDAVGECVPSLESATKVWENSTVPLGSIHDARWLTVRRCGSSQDCFVQQSDTAVERFALYYWQIWYREPRFDAKSWWLIAFLYIVHITLSSDQVQVIKSETLQIEAVGLLTKLGENFVPVHHQLNIQTLCSFSLLYEDPDQLKLKLAFHYSCCSSTIFILGQSCWILIVRPITVGGCAGSKKWLNPIFKASKSWSWKKPHCLPLNRSVRVASELHT